MTKGKISVLIPTFNRIDYIKETILCALDQSHSNVEICVSDNNSSDGTWEVIEEFARKVSRIKAIRQVENIGPVLNWKACVGLATGKYSKFLFSDDLISVKWLETTTQLLDNDRSAGLVITPAIISSKPFDGPLFYDFALDTCRISSHTYLSLQLGGSSLLPVSPGAMLFRTRDVQRNLLHSLKGVPDHDFNSNGAGVDLLLSCLISVQYSHVIYTPRECAFFRHHPGSITIANKDGLVSTGYQLARRWMNDKLKLKIAK
jgi:glycosyltransferase involved in cell wall biosynthesis